MNDPKFFKAARTIWRWEIGEFLGCPVVRGVIDGEWATTRLLWWSHGRFGVTSLDGPETEEKLKIGGRVHP